MNLVPQEQHDKVPFNLVIGDKKEKERLVLFKEKDIRVLERFIDAGFVHGLIEERICKLEKASDVAQEKEELS